MDGKALFIVDVQEGGMTSELRRLAASIETLQERYCSIFVFRFVNVPASPWDKWLNWRRFREDKETALAFKPVQGAYLYDKGTYTCLSPDVLNKLEKDRVSEVHIAGLRTENCVLKTAVDLFETNKFRPVILARYCGSPHRNLHDAALDILEKFIGKDQIVYD